MYNMSPYSLSRSFRDKPCRAVIYGRASTEHEAQVKALQNQMQWYGHWADILDNPAQKNYLF